MKGDACPVDADYDCEPFKWVAQHSSGLVQGPESVGIGLHPVLQCHRGTLESRRLFEPVAAACHRPTAQADTLLDISLQAGGKHLRLLDGLLLRLHFEILLVVHLRIPEIWWWLNPPAGV